METIKNTRIYVSIMSAIISIIITVTLLVIIQQLTKSERYPSAHSGLVVTTVTYNNNPTTLGLNRDEMADFLDFGSEEIKSDRLEQQIPNTNIHNLPRISMLAPFPYKIQEPIILEAPDPVYPDNAKKDGIEGKIILRFEVDKRGFVHNAEVVDAEPSGVFEESALSAISKYKFIPAKRNNMSVISIVYLPINYKINEMAYLEQRHEMLYTLQ